MLPRTEKIQVHDYGRQFNATIHKLRKRKDVRPRNKKLIEQFCNDCLEGRTEARKQKKKISVAGIRKYLFSLIVVAKHFPKDFDKVEADDKDEPTVRAFVRALEENKLRKDKGGPYSEKTKRDIKVTLRKFFKWLFGDNVVFPRCVRYIDTSVSDGEVPALSRDEVVFWAERETTLRKKALILFLFDSGVRAEELLNIRMKHVSYDRDEKAYRVRVEFSKTKPRTIFVPVASETLRFYLDTYEDRFDPEAQLFPITYDALRKFIRLSARAHLKKEATPHLLRHSSATYYCSKLNSYQLSYRYGWSMSSSMPNRYIDREGLVDKQSSKAVKIEFQEELKEENRRMKEDLTLLQSQLGKLNSVNDLLDYAFKNYPQFREIITKVAFEKVKSGKGFAQKT